MSCLTVVNLGLIEFASGISSNPTMETASGILI